MWLWYSRQGTHGSQPRLLSGGSSGLQKKTCTLLPPPSRCLFLSFWFSIETLILTASPLLCLCPDWGGYYAVTVHPLLPTVIDVLPAQTVTLSWSKQELSDLVVALHAIQRCLSNAVFDWTSKILHFGSEWVACSSTASGLKKEENHDRGRQREGVEEWSWVEGTVCN